MSAPITPMRLRVTQVLGIVSADLPLSQITLVGGLNGAGKSSLLHAAAAAALSVWALRGVKKKPDGKMIVREGATTGSATLDWVTGASRVSWPSCDVDQTGDAPLRPFGSPAAIGAIRWLEQSQERRQADLADRLGLAPTAGDVAEWLARRTQRPVAEWTDFADLLHMRISTSGWDPVHKEVAENATKIKGRWEEVAGRRFGSVIAAEWTPQGLLKGEDYSLPTAEKDLTAAKGVLDELRSAGAITDAEVRMAETNASRAAPLRAEANGLQATQMEMVRALERMQRERLTLAPVMLSDPDAEIPAHDCPYCRKALHIRRTKDGLQVVKAVFDAKPPVLTEEQKAELATLDLAIAETSARIKEGSAAVSRAEAAAMAAERWAARLAELRAAPQVNAEALAAAQAEVARLEERRDAIKKLLRTRELYAEWLAEQPIIEALSPGGVRQHVLQTRLDAFNIELGALSEVARWATVQVTVNGDATFGGRPYALCSESERWRVDLTLQVALAMREQARLLLVDRLDVLVPQARVGVMLLLRHAGIPSLVCMTAREPDHLPKLEANGLGRCWWLEDGAPRPV